MLDHELREHLLTRLREVQRNLHGDVAENDHAHARFADVLDSMGMVEFVALIADDCGVKPEAIEKAVGRDFGTIADLAAALTQAGIGPGSQESVSAYPHTLSRPEAVCGWLAATAVRLPKALESAAEIDRKLQRPTAWLESHAGIRQRRIWADEDPLAAAAEAGCEALEKSGLKPAQVGALLVVSEAPPVLLGLAAALHHRLRLPGNTVALDIGGACTAFLAALWTAQAILPQREIVLIISVEAASRFLRVQPGPAGEAAALFGDAAAAMVIGRSALAGQSVPLLEVSLAADGGQAALLQLHGASPDGVELRMRGTELAASAIHVMADSVEALAKRHGIEVAQLAAVIAHGGNGRMPALLARKLGLPPERVWSETAVTGNLGSASLPVAWAARQPPKGPIIWTAVGAGLAWGAALTGS
ncbi:MAG TPA: 3-oxoacyl-[acyl-carrier-protein] synthase III C-terminal domain-containing protein [Gemmataceae bacterium]|jgi:3-oxoacyl-[acyl-carrier-protein] synthase-3|nr:3-oxoacyl-[acyl-carrier-protein] synthase III C-terminal domain-containing protein [Gemmataceae bacterium]